MTASQTAEAMSGLDRFIKHREQTRRRLEEVEFFLNYWNDRAKEVYYDLRELDLSGGDPKEMQFKVIHLQAVWLRWDQLYSVWLTLK